jgi:hypothetical protein
MVFRATTNFRARFRAWFKKKGLRKSARLVEVVGCAPEYLVQHIEAQFKPGMSWDNYGVHGWHVDHIVPLASAGNDVDAMLKLWHYTNLQPLWAKENLSKGSRHKKSNKPQVSPHRLLPTVVASAMQGSCSG